MNEFDNKDISSEYDFDWRCVRFNCKSTQLNSTIQNTNLRDALLHNLNYSENWLNTHN